MSRQRTVIHLLRHGEVDNPTKVLYGRLPGYLLSDLGREMAERVADHLSGNDIRVVISSPLERAQATAAPVAARHGLGVDIDERLIEATTVFQGLRVGMGDGILREPRYWRHVWNPFRPSWGEPYLEISRRMRQAVNAAVAKARGGEAVMVSHQLPIWVVRLAAERRPFVHDPRHRQCSLASLTSLNYSDDELVSVSYSEPARDLLPGAQSVAGA
jgi:broad specificity phosphatase PhoE